MRKRKVFVIGFGILIFAIVYLLYVSNKVLIEPITTQGFEKYSYCTEDSDCVRAGRPVCSSCGCGAYANEAYLEEYRMKVEEMCEGYRGSVCGVTACPRTQPKCKQGRCVGVAKDYNIINQFIYHAP